MTCGSYCNSSRWYPAIGAVASAFLMCSSSQDEAGTDIEDCVEENTPVLGMTLIYVLLLRRDPTSGKVVHAHLLCWSVC